MNLLELTEPLFDYICKLNRAGRLRSTVDYEGARANVKGLFEDLGRKAAADGRLSAQYKKLEMPLVFFVDSMISESSLPFASKWHGNRLAYDRNELAGDEKFFDLLDETLNESGEDVAERLAVFYVCLGLGFCGIYFKQPEYLRSLMQRLLPRIKNFIGEDPASRLCPEAYDHVDTRNLVEPPGLRMIFVVLVFLAFSLAVGITYFYLYNTAKAQLRETFRAIETNQISNVVQAK
jgi:type IV/VI secretion system ImpK/VasF family protein